MKKRIVFAVSAALILLCGFLYLFSKTDDSDSILLTSEMNKSDMEEEASVPASFYVYVIGEVVSPGVYSLDEGQRIFEAVEKAGGTTGNADLSGFNPAEKIYDGMRIYVPAIGELLSENTENISGKDKVNINTADRDELCLLPGIGSQKADSIIAYRKKNGAFHSAEEIMNVSGIGESIFERIKDFIKV